MSEKFSTESQEEQIRQQIAYRNALSSLQDDLANKIEKEARKRSRKGDRIEITGSPSIRLSPRVTSFIKSDAIAEETSADWIDGGVLLVRRKGFKDQMYLTHVSDQGLHFEGRTTQEIANKLLDLSIAERESASADESA